MGIGSKIETIRDWEGQFPGYADNPIFPDGAIDCALGHSPNVLPDSVINFLKDFDFGKLSLYALPEGDELLFSKLSKKFPALLNSRDNLFFGHGINHLLERVFAYVYPKAHVLGVGPQFVYAVKHCINHGGTYRPIHRNLSSPTFPMEELMSEIERHASKYNILYIDNPNNPLGSFVALSDVKTLVRHCEKFGIVVLVDEAFGDFQDDSASAINLVNEFKNILVLRSFSKLYGLAGLRVGYMVVPEAVALQYRKYSQPFEPTPLGLILASKSLDDPQFRNRIIQDNISKKKLLSDVIRNSHLKILPTDSSTSIMVIHDPFEPLYEAFLRSGILTTNGIHFGVTHRKFTNHFVRFRIPKNESDLEAVIQIIRNEMKPIQVNK